MRISENIEYTYLSSKPDEPKSGDVYQDDDGVWSFIGERWYLREDLDIESMRSNQRNEKINGILDDK